MGAGGYERRNSRRRPGSLRFTAPAFYLFLDCAVFNEEADLPGFVDLFNPDLKVVFVRHFFNELHGIGIKK
jgi:hypothetical protein